MSQELRLELPDSVLAEIAERAAALVLERLSGPASESEFLTVAEAAEFLRAKPQRVYDLLSAGRLSRVKDGSRVLVRRSDLLAHVGQALGSYAGAAQDRGIAA